MSIAEIKRAIEALPTEEQAEIAIFLEELIAPDDFELHPAWKDELRARAEQIDRGEAVMMPWEEVRAGLERDFG